MFFIFCGRFGSHPRASLRPGVPLPGVPRADAAPRAGSADSAAYVDKGTGGGVFCEILRTNTREGLHIIMVISGIYP